MALGIVLAGRRNVGALRTAAPDCAWEALIPIAGRPMAGYVVAALAGARDVQRVVVVGPGDLGQPGVTVIPPGDGISASLRLAWTEAQRAAPADEVVVAAGDAPLLSAGSVTALIEQSRRRGLAIGYPIATRVACLASFPGVRRTYVRLREGSFSGGNCVYLRAEAVERVLGLLERVHRDRKRPLRLARLLGWRLVWGLLSGQARLRHAEDAASRLVGAPAGAWISPDPSVAVDVDSPGDLDLCRTVLTGGRPLRAGGRSPDPR